MALPAILQQLSKNSMSRMAQPIKQMMTAVRTAQNPQLALNNLIMQNPQMKQVMDIVQKHGGDPMRAFEEEAKACGMDPQEIMNMLK